MPKSRAQPPPAPRPLVGLLRVGRVDPRVPLPAVLKVADGRAADGTPYRAYLASADRTVYVLAEGRPMRAVTLGNLLAAILDAEEEAP